MKHIIGVYTHDFRKGIRIGKIHLAFSGEKTFCGSVERRTIARVESGDYLGKKWIVNHHSDVCQICAKSI
jgi:hypothetical protein